MKTCSTCGRQNPDDYTWCPECGTTPRIRTVSPEEFLEKVSDRASFIEFLTALAEEREEAERMERDGTALSEGRRTQLAKRRHLVFSLGVTGIF